MKNGNYRYPYVTVEELRKSPGLLEIQVDDRGGARFIGPTDLPLAFKYFPHKERGIYCETGPVFGKFLLELQNNGYQNIHAVDFVDMLSFPDRDRITFHAVDMNRDSLPYPGEFFDGIASWGFGEHLENPYHYMREVHRVLKPDGLFLFSLPNVAHIVSRLFFLKDAYFRRWNFDNNHIAIIPNGVFEKTFLRYFDLVERVFRKPLLKIPPYRVTRVLEPFLPENEFFGDYVHYVLRKKTFTPFGDVIKK